jgi:toxin ParE1/3/4
MNLPLIITPEAEDDIAEAKSWYDRKRSGLGDSFLLSVEEALDRIRRLPEAGKEVFPGVRRAVVRRFPYGVFSRVESTCIAVIAVYHNRQNPRGLLDRAFE